MATSEDISLDSLLPVLQEIENLFTHCFGPNALHNMICTSTGKLIISASGWTTLDALHESHPLLQVVIDAIRKHCSLTGDGCKSFILVLNECLKFVVKGARDYSHRGDMQRHLVLMSRTCNKLVHEVLYGSVLLDLMRHVTCTKLCQENISTIQNVCSELVQTYFDGQFPKVTSKYLTDVLIRFVFGACCDISRLEEVLLFVIDNFFTLCIKSNGLPVNNSSLVEGIVIPRRFTLNCFPEQRLTCVKFVLLDCSLEGSNGDTKAVFECADRVDLEQTMTWKKGYADKIMQEFSSQGVNLILSSYMMPDYVLSVVRIFGISVIHALAKEDLDYISLITNTCIMDNPTGSRLNIGEAESCEPTVLGNASCVCMKIAHLSFMTPRHLVICGPTEGICQQYCHSVLCAVKCLRMWLFTNNVKSEFHQHVEKNLHKKNCDSDFAEEKSHLSCLDTRCNSSQTSALDGKECSVQRGVHDDGKEKFGLSITGGATFELLIYKYLTEFMTVCSDDSILHLCRMATQAILSIPRCLVNNSFREGNKADRFVHVLRDIEKNHAQGMSVCLNARSGKLDNCHESHNVESFSAKWQLLLSIFQVLEQLLRIDKIVPVKHMNKDEMKKE